LYMVSIMLGLDEMEDFMRAYWFIFSMLILYFGVHILKCKVFINFISASTDLISYKQDVLFMFVWRG